MHIDYRALNSLTKKNSFPLDVMATNDIHILATFIMDAERNSALKATYENEQLWANHNCSQVKDLQIA